MHWDQINIGIKLTLNSHLNKIKHSYHLLIKQDSAKEIEIFAKRSPEYPIFRLALPISVHL